jgi:hypothetical protein
MAISEEITKPVEYAGNGSRVDFPYGERVLEESHLRVRLISTANPSGVETSDYTVAGVGNDAGVTITMNTAPATGITVSIDEVIPAVQEYPFEEGTKVPISVFETGFDKLTKMISALKGSLTSLTSRALQFPEVDSSSISSLLPAASVRASKALGFNASGEPEVIEKSTVAASDAGSITYTSAAGVAGKDLEAKIQGLALDAKADSGATGDGVTDDVTALQAWLSKVDELGIPGYLPEGTFIVSTSISVDQTNPIRLFGPGVIKASGSARFELFKISDITKEVRLDIKVDGNNLINRPVVLESEDVAVADLADVTFGPSFASLNAKESVASAGGYGVYCFGGFRKILFDGLIDTVTSSRADGSCLTSGVEVAFSSTGEDDYPSLVVMGPNARIIGVTNNNTSAPIDADGFKVRVDTDMLDSAFVVSPGAYFENCLGRAIKSQAQSNSVMGATILRNAYNGQVEIDIQRAGGIVSGCTIIQDGYSSSAIVGATMPAAADSDTREVSVTDNRLVVLGTPAANTATFALVSGADDTSAITGVNLTGNKVLGEVDYFASIRVANVAGNRIVMRDNWAKSIGTAFVELWRQGSGAVECRFVASGNSCDSACDGIEEAASCTSVIETWESNYNLSNEDTFTRAGAGPIVTWKKFQFIETDSGDLLTLADGTEGQEIYLLMTVDLGNAILTPDNLANGSTLTFDDVGDSAHLVFMDGSWVFMGGTATLA